VENGLNIVLALAFVALWGVTGLAWAYSISYLVAAVLSWRALSRVVPSGLRTDLLTPVLGRALLAALTMGVTCWLARDLAGSEDGWGAIVRLVVAGGIGVVVYFATLVGLGGMDPRRPTFPWREQPRRR
jgi:peptidoglycan biosynthesis protein MviN/MurJ (putative lipid II flippase)